MPLLPLTQNDFYSEETDSESPASEQLLQKIGENLNYLNNFTGIKVTKFLTSGTFVVPEGVSEVLVIGCGGGGGGCQGGGSGDVISGFGAPLGTIRVAVTPLANISVGIGSGGSGTSGIKAADGGNSFFGSTIFLGGSGGGRFGVSPSYFIINGRICFAIGSNNFLPPVGYAGGTDGAGGGNYLHPESSPNIQSPTGFGINDYLRGGAGPFGIGGAGSGTSPAGTAAANTGGGGGSVQGSGTGGNGGSGRIIVIY